MTSREATNLDTVRRYFESLSSGRIGADLSDLFTPDVVQEEFPNRLMPQGATRDLAAMREGAERGHAFMKDQQFQLLTAVADGDRAAVEARWQAEVAVGGGPIPPGTVMRARFAIFFEFREGKIARQRNYDCFDPW
jgi:ketosteroid isomerase-like protein